MATASIFSAMLKHQTLGHVTVDSLVNKFAAASPTCQLTDQELAIQVYFLTCAMLLKQDTAYHELRL